MEDVNSTVIVTEEHGKPVSIITFILLLIVEIPSIFCTIFILIFFFVNWHSLMIKVLYNHAIFLLIIISLLYITLDLPFTISYYHLSYDRFRTRSFCVWWHWLDYTLVLISLFLTATASIQRHILIFYARLLHGLRKRWILHFIPLIFCVFYPSIFYLILIVFYPCKHSYNENSLFCPSPCYSNDVIVFYIDWILNVILPVIIIVVANMALIGRAIYLLDKFRQSQSHVWKKRRKLTLQLLAFSSLYVIGWVPSTIISILKTLFLPNLYHNTPNLYYINNLNYFVCPLQPFICLFALPELLKFIKGKMKRRTTVVNISATMMAETHA